MSKKGFTLIELLMVVAIIALLSSFVMTSVMSTRSKGDDANKIMAVRQVQNALAMYYNDFNKYPATTSILMVATSQNGGRKYIDSIDGELGIWYAAAKSKTETACDNAATPCRYYRIGTILAESNSALAKDSDDSSNNIAGRCGATATADKTNVNGTAERCYDTDADMSTVK